MARSLRRRSGGRRNTYSEQRGRSEPPAAEAAAEVAAARLAWLCWWLRGVAGRSDRSGSRSRRAETANKQKAAAGASRHAALAALPAPAGNRRRTCGIATRRVQGGEASKRQEAAAASAAGGASRQPGAAGPPPDVERHLRRRIAADVYLVPPLVSERGRMTRHNRRACGVAPGQWWVAGWRRWPMDLVWRATEGIRQYV